MSEFVGVYNVLVQHALTVYVNLQMNSAISAYEIISIPQWGTANEETMVPSVEYPQLSKVLILKPGFQIPLLSQVLILKPRFQIPQLSKVLILKPGFQNP